MRKPSSRTPFACRPAVQKPSGTSDSARKGPGPLSDFDVLCLPCRVIHCAGTLCCSSKPNQKLQDARREAEARTTQKPKIFWLLPESKSLTEPTAWLPRLPEGSQSVSNRGRKRPGETGLFEPITEPCPPSPSLRQLGEDSSGGCG